MSTPMRQQYLEIKRQYPDTILLFRLGDFYETFDDDARLVSQVCDVVLTSRPVGNDQRVPLAGVPYHALDIYLAKLVAAGHKVAICEQLTDPSLKGLMPREVVRIVTPGTVLEPELLSERRNNFLVSLVMEGERAGLAYVDITTGEFATTQIESADVAQTLTEELERLRPAELLHPTGMALPGGIMVERLPRTPYETWRFEEQTTRNALLAHFGVTTLAGFGCEMLPLAIRAAGGLLQYLAETQKNALGQLVGMRTYALSEFVILDTATRRNLELLETIRTRSAEGSLLGILDQTETPMGARLLRAWIGQPLLDRVAIERRLDCVAQMAGDSMLRLELRRALARVGDLERLTNRIIAGLARPRDLTHLHQALTHVPTIVELLAPQPEGSPLGAIVAGIDPCGGIVDFIAAAIADDPPATVHQTGLIRRGFSAELDELWDSSQHAREWIAGLEQNERQRTGIKSLKVGYNKVFGYYIEVTNANRSLVPTDYIRKQTVSNAERYVTHDLKEYEALLLHAEERILDLEQTLFREICERIAAAGQALLETARRLADLDVYASLAEVAVTGRYVRPEIADDQTLDISAGRHPVVERSLHNAPFVPNDLHLSPEEQISILTGPNMSGKSTYLRQTALIVLMAQIGSFVPADRAYIGVVDRIFTRIGAQDEIAAGQSTFMVEMVETANILNHATPRSLLILDEIGRGTSTYDGISIAWAVVEYLHSHPRCKAKTLFATHYHELIQLADVLPHVRNYNVAVSEIGDQVVFQHRIVAGGADRSYGIHVGQLAGLPRAVIRRAQEMLEKLEANGTRASERPLRPTLAAQQLPLFALTDPLVEELRALDVTSMTPLEAINKLFELQKKAQDKPHPS